MNNSKLKKRFDKDEKLAKRAKQLVWVSAVLLVLQVTGATVKEANTFLFRIEFTNQHGLTYLLLGAVFYLFIRYFNYAQPYHAELFKLSSSRMISNYRIFNYSHEDEPIGGFLCDAIDVCCGDEPGLMKPRYVKSGFLKRSLAYNSRFFDERHGEVYVTKHINLTKFTTNWTKAKYVKLLWIELKYRVSAFIYHREHLDILAPYFLAVVAVASVFYLN